MVKDPATYEEMIAKLQEHGCVVKDEMYAKLVLKEIGYYRLSAYFYLFGKQTEHIRKVLTFTE